MNTKNLLFSIVIMSALSFGFSWGAAKDKTAEKEPVTTSSWAAKKNVPAANQELTLGAMMNALSENLSSWNSLSEENKEQAVEAVKLFYRDTLNTAILRPSEFYVGQINDGLRANPSMMQANIMSVMRMMSVAEYDFYNGQNKDALALETLGPQAYEELMTRRQD